MSTNNTFNDHEQQKLQQSESTFQKANPDEVTQQEQDAKNFALPIEQSQFRQKLQNFMRSIGNQNFRIPQIAGRQLNLLKLYRQVTKRGGHQAVSNAKLWRQIVNQFQLPASCTSASFTLRQHYQRCLYEYQRQHLPMNSTNRQQRSTVFGAGSYGQQQYQEQSHYYQSSSSSSQNQPQQYGIQNSSNQNNPDGSLLRTRTSEVNRNQSNVIQRGSQSYHHPSQQQHYYTSSYNNVNPSNSYHHHNHPSANNQRLMPVQNINKTIVPQSTGKRIIFKQSPIPILYNSHHHETSYSRLPTRLNDEQIIHSHQVSSINIHSKSSGYQIPLSSTVVETKRMVLAFESLDPKQITWTLNTLTLFSCNNDQLFLLDKQAYLIDSMQSYLQYLIKIIATNNHSIVDDLNSFEENKMFKKLKVFKLQGLAEVMESIPLNQNIIGRGNQNQEVSSTTGLSSKKGAFTNSNLGGIGKRVGGGGALVQSHYPSRTGGNSHLLDNTQKGYLPDELDKMPRHQQLLKLAELGITKVIQPLLMSEACEHFRQTIHVLRNLSFIQQNEQYITRNKRLIALIIVIFTTTTEEGILHNCLDLITNLGKYIVLKDVETICCAHLSKIRGGICVPYTEVIPNFFERLGRYMNRNLSQKFIVEQSIESLRRLSFVSGNQAIMQELAEFYVEQLVDNLMSQNFQTRQGAVDILLVLSDRKEQVKNLIGCQKNCIKRLVALLSGGLQSKIEEKITKFAAVLLNNLSLSPINKPKLLPFQMELALIAASNSVVSKVICEILHGISEYQVFNKN